MDRSEKILSRRECTILAFLAEGHSNEYIARALHVPEFRVQVQIRTMLRKLKRRNVYELISWAYQEGVLK
jgi:DNA-binding NarL/FixJ family response regulator